MVRVHTAHKSLDLSFTWVDIRIGKIARGIDYNERRGVVDHLHPGKKIWGVLFIKRFFEP